jgi:HEAT repeat protein
VQLVQNAHSNEFRAAAADALNAVFQRLQTAGTKFDLSAFVSAVGSGSVETRLALLPICSDVVQEPNRAALRAAITDTNAQIHDAAIHALCDTKDADLLPDLVNLSCDTNKPATRLLAIRGCVRLTTQEDTIKIPNATKLEAFAKILATPLDTQAKRVMLSGLSNTDDAKTLALAIQMLDDTTVRPEAEQAVVRIASDISAKNPNEARDALKKIIADSTNPDIKKPAEAALKKIK